MSSALRFADVRRFSTICLAVLPMFVGGCTKQATDQISDSRDLLATSAERRITSFQKSLLQNQDIELSVDIPAASPDDLDGYAHDRMERLRVGGKTSAARGVLLIIDADAASVRMEIGTDLEHVYPDAFVSFVEYDQMAPFFAESRVPDGIEATVELLVARAQGAVASGDYDPADSKDRSDFSAGGGARAQAPIGVPDAGVRGTVTSASVPAQLSPAEVLPAYVELLRRQDLVSEHGLYTPETRVLLANRTITPAQQRSEYRQLAPLLEIARYVQKDSFAVALFHDRPTVPPYFFRSGGDGWMLDLAASSRIIGFDLQNQWHRRSSAHEYGFAFQR